MAIDHRPKHKRCRALGEKICQSEKCPVTRRSYPPGVHGPNKGKSKKSTYGIQLREKQKAKWLYGIMERQFRNYFTEALKNVGNTGERLVQLLETRLDNTVYRLGFAATRRQARQLVNHGFFTVNGREVNIASYQVKPGEVIGVKNTKAPKKIFGGLEDRLTKKQTPSWLTLDTEKLEGKVLSRPIGEDLKQSFDPKLIVELYSR
ncbi:MAG: 30S ribosomal protein S4 [bacterium]